MNYNNKVVKDEELLDDINMFQRLVGKLIYLTITRPDISYVVSFVSQFMQKPTKGHMKLIDQILRYLKSTPGRGILMKNQGHTTLTVYTDADWAGNPLDRRSTSGLCAFVGGNLITWQSKKQPVVARSSAEADIGPWQLLQVKSCGYAYCFTSWDVLALTILPSSSVIIKQLFI
jgi:hypothetical protein